MQKTMQVDVSVFRTQESLDNGVEKIKKVDQSYRDLGIKDRSMIWNSGRPFPEWFDRQIANF